MPPKTPTKILVVDNSRAILGLLDKMLSSKGFEVKTAIDGLMALDILETWLPDIIFVDLVMPNISGDKLCKIIRSKPRLADVFIAILSGVALEQQIDCTAFGANACIAKGPYKNIEGPILEVIHTAEKDKHHTQKEILNTNQVYKRQVTEELLAVKQHFEITLAHLDEGFLEFNSQSRIIYANQSAARMTGLNEEQLLALNFFDLFSHDHSRRRIEECVRGLGHSPITLGEDESIEFNEREFVIHLLPIRQERNPSTIAILQDITERKKTAKELENHRIRLEELVQTRTKELLDSNESLRKEISNRMSIENALRLSEQEWHDTFNAITDFVSVHDKNDLILRVNKSFADFLKQPQESFYGKTCRELFSKVSGVEICPHTKAIAERRAVTIETDPSLLGFPALITASPLMNGNGEIKGTVHIIHDVSPIKKAEAEQKKLYSQFLQAQKMESVGRLAGGIAHDFNNIVSAIIGYSQLAMRSLPEDSPARQYIETLFETGERATALTRQLLAFSRKEATQMLVVDLNHIIDGMAKILRRLVGEDIELKINKEMPLPKILADPGQLEQILMNLIINARDAMKDGGKMHITTSSVAFAHEQSDPFCLIPPGFYVLLDVTDDGKGIAVEIQDKIFEPFFTTKDREKGTGLGLATVYAIVKKHDGFISMQSAPGKGTTFSIYIPATEGQSTIEEQQVIPDLPGGDETIFIVEDDQAIRDLTYEILRSIGYRVLTAGDGREALDLLDRKAEKIDLLLTDLIMPGMNGRELAEALTSRHQDCKVLFMSGYTDDILNQYGMNDQTVHFIQKPLTPDALTRKIRDVLDS